MHPTEFLNVRLLKEIAEFINEETEIETMLSGALRKFLQGTNFETGWIFFISDNGKQQLIVSENLPEALSAKWMQPIEKWRLLVCIQIS